MFIFDIQLFAREEEQSGSLNIHKFPDLETYEQYRTTLENNDIAIVKMPQGVINFLSGNMTQPTVPSGDALLDSIATAVAQDSEHQEQTKNLLKESLREIGKTENANTKLKSIFDKEANPVAANYATKEEYNTLKADLERTSSSVLDIAKTMAKNEIKGYLTKADGDTYYQPIGNYLTQHQDISGLATKEEVALKMAETSANEKFATKESLAEANKKIQDLEARPSGGSSPTSGITQRDADKRYMPLTPESVTVSHPTKHSTSIFLKCNFRQGKTYEFFSDADGNFGIFDKSSERYVMQMNKDAVTMHGVPRIPSYVAPKNDNDLVAKKYVDDKFIDFNVSPSITVNNPTGSASIFLNCTAGKGVKYEFFSDGAGTFGVYNKSNESPLFTLNNTDTIFYAKPKTYRYLDPVSAEDLTPKKYVDEKIQEVKNAITTATTPKSLNGDSVIKAFCEAMLKTYSQNTTEYDKHISSSGQITDFATFGNNIAKLIQDSLPNFSNMLTSEAADAKYALKSDVDEENAKKIKMHDDMFRDMLVESIAPPNGYPEKANPGTELENLYFTGRGMFNKTLKKLKFEGIEEIWPRLDENKLEVVKYDAEYFKISNEDDVLVEIPINKDYVDTDTKMYYLNKMTEQTGKNYDSELRRETYRLHGLILYAPRKIRIRVYRADRYGGVEELSGDSDILNNDKPSYYCIKMKCTDTTTKSVTYTETFKWKIDIYKFPHNIDPETAKENIKSESSKYIVSSFITENIQQPTSALIEYIN